MLAKKQKIYRNPFSQPSPSHSKKYAYNTYKNMALLSMYVNMMSVNGKMCMCENVLTDGECIKV